MNNLRKRLDAIESASTAKGRIRYMFRFESQDHEEAVRRWEAAEALRGRPLEPDEEVHCIVWGDPEGKYADEWWLTERGA